MISMTWGELPSGEDFRAQCEATNSIPFKMELVPEDYKVFAEAVNQGIDSHLEAVFLVDGVEEICDPFPKGKLAIADANSLRTLVRRLAEIGDRQWNEDDARPEGERLYDNENPPGASLASDIMGCIGFEWI
jgi:hypothetical protein